MKIRDLITELIKMDMDDDVINKGWYPLTKVTDHETLPGHVILVFEEDD